MIGTLLAFALLVIGESLNIFAEMFSAKLPGWQSLFEYKNLFLFVMVIAGCSFLLFGYAVGYGASKSIWTVTVASVVAILLVEPILSWIFFHQLPEKGALVGVILGAIGFIATVVWV